MKLELCLSRLGFCRAPITPVSEAVVIIRVFCVGQEPGVSWNPLVGRGRRKDKKLTEFDIRNDQCRSAFNFVHRVS
ncbi:hypothetical protein AG1IA_07967 [Rhizoctonia solani AG-1 IA]|uniref:Uncharacterized protein n=1 Tax=Thanatephorus cucumeris (strain AG1-IA) TaxID=983506 RepID=L8WNS2_THACA|nr:hypothetical protein AG1IA_07967 [Rhizoctonia solani AG-1 IA]